MREMTVQEINAYLREADPFPMLLDVREPWEYGICHLPNTELIPMRTIPVELGKLDTTKEIIVICHHGVRSHHVARFLEQHGFDNVVNMMGGMAAWARDIDPTMATY
ncbi:sulfurtransferase [Achromatium sp. WMS2]|nr:sulfurtransferase [Achromatium sp. WMS2]